MLLLFLVCCALLLVGVDKNREETPPSADDIFRDFLRRKMRIYDSPFFLIFGTFTNNLAQHKTLMTLQDSDDSFSLFSLSLATSDSSSLFSCYYYKCNSSFCSFCFCSCSLGFAAIFLAADLGTKEGFAFVASTGLDGSGGGVSSLTTGGGLCCWEGVGAFEDGLPDMTLTGWTDSTGAQPVFFGFCSC